MGRRVENLKTVDFSRHVSSAALAAGARMAQAMTGKDDLRAALERLTLSYGFLYYTVATVPAKGTRKAADAVVVSNCPQEFFDIYDEADLLPESPFFDRLRRSTVPFCHDFRLDPPSALTKAVVRLRALSEAHDMKCSAYIPVHDIHGTRGVTIFSGNRTAVSEDEMKELAFLSAHIFDRLSDVLSLPVKSSGILSRRELECLNWAAEGKTTAEIAQILTLSDYTVNHYLNRATRKLDSVNRVQTVAKAIRAGLIG